MFFHAKTMDVVVQLFDNISCFCYDESVISRAKLENYWVVHAVQSKNTGIDIIQDLSAWQWWNLILCGRSVLEFMGYSWKITLHGRSIQDDRFLREPHVQGLTVTVCIVWSETFVVYILVPLGLRNLNVDRDSNDPVLSLACAPSVISFSLRVSASTMSSILQNSNLVLSSSRAYGTTRLHVTFHVMGIHKPCTVITGQEAPTPPCTDYKAWISLVVQFRISYCSPWDLYTYT